MCGPDALGDVASAVGGTALSVASSVGTKVVSDAIMGAPDQPKVPALPGPPAQPAPAAKQDSGAVVKIGGIDDTSDEQSTATKRRGGSSIGIGGSAI